jgi:hypothetical protein
MKLHATRVCRIIIDELVFPDSLKSIKPRTKNEYVVDNLLVRLAYTEIQFRDNTQVYDESALKALGREFRSLSLLASIIE